LAAKENKGRYEEATIATQTERVFKDTETEEQLDGVALLCRVANDVEELKKKLL